MSKMTMLVSQRVIVPLLIVITFFSFAGAEPPSVPPAESKIQASEVEDFATFLGAARRETGAAFLIEDAPRHLRLPESARKNLKAELAARPDTASQTTLVAGLYDFEVIRVTPRFFIWRKRYTDPNDVPNVTFAEARDSSRKLHALFETFAPHNTTGIDAILSNRYQREMVGALSPEQTERAQSETGLPVRELSPAQKEQFWQATLAFATMGARTFIGTANYNEEMLERGRLEFGHVNLPPGQAPRAEDVAYFFPFRDSPRIGSSLLTDVKPIEPDPGEAAMRAKLAPSFLPLPTFFQSLSLLPPDPARNPPVRTLLRVESALAKKNMLFLGTFPATQEEAMLWIAGVTNAFGWEARVMPDASRAAIGQCLVEVRRVPARQLKQRKDFVHLGAILISLIPEPVRRASLVEEQRRLFQEVERLSAPYTPILRTSRTVAEATAETQGLLAERQRLRDEADSRYFAVQVRGFEIGRLSRGRLRDALHARLAKLPATDAAEKRLRSADLSDREKAGFVLSGLFQSLKGIRSWMIDTPVYLARFDEQSLLYRHVPEAVGDRQYDLGIGGYVGGKFEKHRTP